MSTSTSLHGWYWGTAKPGYGVPRINLIGMKPHELVECIHCGQPSIPGRWMCRGCARWKHLK